MMASLAAAGRGARVTVLDRTEKTGKKILVAGNGRCNVTNVRQTVDRYHGAPPAFIDAVLRAFSAPQTMDFFKSLGLICVEEEAGRVYPSCNQAASVRGVLQYEMERRGVQIHCQTDVMRIARAGDGFRAETKDGRVFTADRVVLSAGGQSAPDMGTCGCGYDLVKSFGHTLTPLLPTLVPIELGASYLKEMDGVRFTGSVAILSEGRVLREAEGEIQWTDYGASGIAVMDLSRTAGECLLNKREAELELRLLSHRTPADILDDVRGRVASRSDETLERALLGIVHSKIIPVLIQAAGCRNRHIACRQVTPALTAALAERLTRWRLPITGTLSWNRAQVTAGGVPAAEIDPATMASKKVPGLFLAGEIVDVDGDTGGFNLQWSWSSGHVAGTHAAA
jgi:predicted Rossmann fold flavoprotein